jgi:hypothetical protein
MKLYKIWQSVNDVYDTFDSAVVCAKNKEEARKIHPEGHGRETTNDEPDGFGYWCTLDNVQVEYIGEAKSGMKKGVVVASYNAG